MAPQQPAFLAESVSDPVPVIPSGAPLGSLGAPGSPPASSGPPEELDASTRWPPWSAPLALATGLLLALFGALLVDIPAAIFGVSLSGSLPPGLEIADTFVQDVAFVAAVVVVARMGGRTVSAWQLGLRPVRFWRGVRGVVIVIVSFLVFSALWAQALNLTGKEKLLDQLGANHNAALLLASAALTCVVAPICEELLFRGYMFTALRNWRGPWLAAVVTGLLFGGVHATSAPVAYLVPLAALGFGLCLLYWRTGSLYPCIAAHCVNNSLAFGSLENWGWQIPVLLVAALASIALLFSAAKRTGLLDARLGPAVA